MMTFEAISKISLLLADLVKRAKDKETFSLIQQIQTYQLIINKALKESNLEIEKLKTENAKLVAENSKLIEENSRLKKGPQEPFMPIIIK